MRRKDREITDEAVIDEIIMGCDCCRLGLSHERGAYVVPMSFGYRREGGRPAFYFHCASEGRRLDMLRENPRAGFELDRGYRLNEARGDVACTCSCAFQSVIGTGRAELITDIQEKKAGLATIMAHYDKRTDWSFEEDYLRAVTVIKLTADEISCKQHQ